MKKNKRLQKKLNNIPSVSTIKVDTGDIIVVKHNKKMSYEDFRFTCKQVDDVFGNKFKVLVIDKDTEIKIIKNIGECKPSRDEMEALLTRLHADQRLREMGFNA